MPSHPSYQVVATTKIPLNDDNSLFSSSPPDPSTPPARQPPRPDLAIHRIRSTARRSVTPLPSSITSPLQQIYSSSPPPPTAAQRQKQVSFQELLFELVEHIQDVQKTFSQTQCYGGSNCKGKRIYYGRSIWFWRNASRETR